MDNISDDLKDHLEKFFNNAQTSSEAVALLAQLQSYANFICEYRIFCIDDTTTKH